MTLTPRIWHGVRPISFGYRLLGSKSRRNATRWVSSRFIEGYLSTKRWG